MVTDTPIKIQIVKSLSNLKPSRMIAVKADNESSFSLFVTDKNGVPYPLKDLQGSGGITGITNTDGNLVITGVNNKVINITPTLLSVINSALQSGDLISTLVNDAGYLTTFTETDPIFQASEASNFVAGDKNKLDNQSGVNSGDETTSSIQTKRPLKTVNNESLEGVGNLQIDYNSLSNIPSSFTPSPHLHTISEITNLQSELDGKESVSNKGIANGYAPLDINNKIPLIHLNDAILGQVNYIGLYDASLNVPALPSATTNKGDYYIVSTAGTQFSLNLEVGDWIISNGTSYNKVDNTDAVSSVNGQTGNVLIDIDSRVPYTGAIQNVDLGEYQIKTGQLELDQTPTGAFGIGKIRWNDSAGTAEIRLKGNNVTLQIGQELVKRVVNKTATNINLLEANYQAVKIIGATGQRLSIDLAQANSHVNSGTTIGIVTETINNNQEGFITYSGEVNQINTTGSLQGESWSDGDVLYLSATTPGAITNIKPSAPNHSVIIGYVEYSHLVNGKIFVKVDNGHELGELHNVDTTISKTTLVNNDNFLVQDSQDLNIWKKFTWENLKSQVITQITDNEVFNFSFEDDSVIKTILNSQITNSNFTSFNYIPQETSETSLDDFKLNGVNFNIENIIDNTSFDIRATAINNASGNYTIKYIVII